MANVNIKTKQSEINKENFGKMNKTYEVNIRSVKDQIMKQLEVKSEKSNDKQKVSEQENDPVTPINNETINNQNPKILKAKDSNDVTLSCNDKQIKTHKQILDLYQIKSDYNAIFDNQEKLKDRIAYNQT